MAYGIAHSRAHTRDRAAKAFSTCVCRYVQFVRSLIVAGGHRSQAGRQAFTLRARRTTSPSVPMCFRRLDCDIHASPKSHNVSDSTLPDVRRPIRPNIRLPIRPNRRLQHTISSVTPAAVAADAPDRGDTSASLRHHPLTSQLIPNVFLDTSPGGGASCMLNFGFRTAEAEQFWVRRGRVISH